MTDKDILAWLMNLFVNTFIQTNDREFSINHVKERFSFSIYYNRAVTNEFELQASNWDIDKS